MRKTIIFQKIKEIEENLDLIRHHVPEEMEDFKALRLVKDGIYKRLEFSVQNLVDIFSMIYSELQLGIPSDLDDIFIGLKKQNVFSKEIIGLVEEMKGLRNILIHRYAEIDDDIVFELLAEHLDDFDKVIAAIEQYVQKKK